MAITTYTDFSDNYLVSDGDLGNAVNLNKAPDQLKKEVDEIKADLNLLSNEAITPWDSATTYPINALVLYNGQNYKALQENTNVTPVDGATWELVNFAVTHPYWTTPGYVPNASELEVAEIGINTGDDTLYTKTELGEIVAVGGGGTGGTGANVDLKRFDYVVGTASGYYLADANKATVFNTDATLDNCAVYIDGVLVDKSNYTTTGTELTLVVPQVDGTQVTIIATAIAVTNLINEDFHIAGAANGTYDGSLTVFPASFDFLSAAVYVNGVLQSTKDYTKGTSDITFAANVITAGDEVRIFGSSPTDQIANLADNSVVYKASEDVGIDLIDLNTVIVDTTNNTMYILKDKSLITSATTLAVAIGLTGALELVSGGGGSGTPTTIERNSYAATVDGQQTFTVTAYNISNVDVYKNGIYLRPTEYTTTNNTTITLNDPLIASDGEYITVVSYTEISLTKTYDKVEITATDTSTTYTGLVYDASNAKVYQNGMLLASSDYTANDGATLTLNTVVTAGDVIFIESYKDAEIVQGATGDVLNYVTKTATYAAVKNDYIFADTLTTGAFNIALPGSPVLGDTVHILDSKGTFDTANVTVTRVNGITIMGIDENMVLNVENAEAKFIYAGGNDWRVIY